MDPRKLNGPFVVLLHQDRADETDDGVFIGEDTNDVGSAFEFAVGALDGAGRAYLDPMLPREVYEGEDVDLGGVEKDGTLWQIGAQLIGDMTAVVWLAAVGVSCANAVAMKADTKNNFEASRPARSTIWSEPLGMEGISKIQVSRLWEEINAKIKPFLGRPIEGDWPHVWRDATCVKVRQGGRIVWRGRGDRAIGVNWPTAGARS